VISWYLLGAVAFAWGLTDPVQGGIEMPTEWIRNEFLWLLRTVLLWGAVPSSAALLAAWALTQRRALRPTTESHA
jgi:hypothetical protein